MAIIAFPEYTRGAEILPVSLPREIWEGIYYQRAKERLLDYFDWVVCSVKGLAIENSYYRRDTLQLCNILHAHGALIAGSVSVWALLGHRNTLWQPRDLDIFVENTQAHSLANALTILFGLKHRMFWQRNGYIDEEAIDYISGCRVSRTFYCNEQKIQIISVNKEAMLRASPFHGFYPHQHTKTLREIIVETFDISICATTFDGREFKTPNVAMAVREMTACRPKFMVPESDINQAVEKKQTLATLKGFSPVTEARYKITVPIRSDRWDKHEMNLTLWHIIRDPTWPCHPRELTFDQLKEHSPHIEEQLLALERSRVNESPLERARSRLSESPLERAHLLISAYRHFWDINRLHLYPPGITALARVFKYAMRGMRILFATPFAEKGRASCLAFIPDAREFGCCVVTTFEGIYADLHREREETLETQLNEQMDEKKDDMKESERCESLSAPMAVTSSSTSHNSDQHLQFVTSPGEYVTDNELTRRKRKREMNIPEEEIDETSNLPEPKKRKLENNDDSHAD